MGTGIPVTYVPARNTIFLSFALAWAEVLGAADIFIGVNALDYSGYPDCRPEFVEAFETLANLATKAGVEGTARVRVHAPLIQLTKAEIVARGSIWASTMVSPRHATTLQRPEQRVARVTRVGCGSKALKRMDLPTQHNIWGSSGESSGRTAVRRTAQATS